MSSNRARKAEARTASIGHTSFVVGRDDDGNEFVVRTHGKGRDVGGGKPPTVRRSRNRAFGG